MTTSHPTPIRLQVARLASSPAKAATSETFFEPRSHCLARNTKNALQAAQRGALMIGAKNLFLAFGAVAVQTACLTQTTTTVAASETLLAIAGATVVDDAATAAMITNAHLLNLTQSHYSEPLPII